jgi:hypothetical protein
MDVATPVIICGFSTRADSNLTEVTILENIAKDFSMQFVHIHSENTGLLWKTVIKSRVLHKFIPLDALREKFAKVKQYEEVMQKRNQQKDFNYFYPEPQKKKKCNVQ